MLSPQTTCFLVRDCSAGSRELAALLLGAGGALGQVGAPSWDPFALAAGFGLNVVTCDMGLVVAASATSEVSTHIASILSTSGTTFWSSTERNWSTSRSLMRNVSLNLLSCSSNEAMCWSFSCNCCFKKNTNSWSLWLLDILLLCSSMYWPPSPFGFNVTGEPGGGGGLAAVDKRPDIDSMDGAADVCAGRSKL